jgi:hypothetical protein
VAMDVHIVFHSTMAPGACIRPLQAPGLGGVGQGLQNNMAVKFVLVSFGLDFDLLRESSILDPSHEIWE